MTLAQAVTLFKTRVDTDTDCDFDASDNDLCTTAIMAGAARWARDTYALWTWKSVLTLAAADQSIDTLGAKSAQKIFHVYGVFINEGWLIECKYREFFDSFPDYFSVANNDHPGFYTLSAPSNVMLSAPISATGAAASNHIIGFRLPATLTYSGGSSTELEGPFDQHEMIVDRAYLDSTKSYIVGDEGLQRRAIIDGDYQKKAKKIREDNLALFKKEVRRAGAGSTRRIRGVGYRF